MSDLSLHASSRDARSAPRGAVPRAASANVSLLVWVIGGALCTVLALGAFGRLLDFGIRRDEMMFVAPAELLKQYALYTDFFYNHVPYSAWLFHGAHAVLGDAGLLFSARAVVALGWAALLLGLCWLVFRLSRSPILTMFCALALLCNETLLSQTGMSASNNLLAPAFGVLGLGLFVSDLAATRVRPLRIFAAGVLLSVGAGIKVSAVAFIVPVALASFLLPASLPFPQRLRKVVLPLALGGILGAAPLLWMLAAAPERFLAHVMGFHTGPHVAFWDAFQHTEPGLAMGLGGKLQLAYQVWLSGSALLLVFGTLICVTVAVTRRPGRASVLFDGPVLVVLATLATTGAMAFVPTPGFPQYYVMPLLCLPLLAALVLRAGTPVVAQTANRILVPSLGTAMLLMVVLALPRIAPGLPVLADPAASEVARFDRDGDRLRAELERRGLADRPVATFMPLYPLEAGLAVYPALATGQFAYRVDAFTPDDLAAQFVMAGPEALLASFEQTPPAAFLLGYEAELEAPLRAYAERHGYRPIAGPGFENRYGKGVLMLPGEEADD